MSERKELTEQEKIKIILYKALNLANSVRVYLDAKSISDEFFKFADHIDWNDHFEKALAEFDRDPAEPK